MNCSLNLGLLLVTSDVVEHFDVLLHIVVLFPLGVLLGDYSHSFLPVTQRVIIYIFIYL